MKAGELYRFPDGMGWARHGLLKVEESRDGLVLRDTYWGGRGQDDRLWRPGEVEGRITLILDLSNARKTDRREWDRFAEEDRAYIPIGGHSEEYWVRNGAAPDPSRIETQLRADIESAQSDIRMAQRRIERAQAELSELALSRARGEQNEGGQNAR